jgi:hypothetical protein
VQQGEDPEVSALAQATRLDALAKEIDETHEEAEKEKEKENERGAAK